MNATYDALDRILTRTYPADTSQNVSFTYDVTGYWPYSFGIGRLSSVTDPAGTVQYGYDERGHAVNDLRTSGTKHFDTYLTYDAVGRVLGISYPSGLWVAWNRDTAGRINSVAMNPPNRSLPGQTVAWLGNNPFGPMDYITYGNGITGPYSLNRDYSINNITLTGTGSTTYQNLSYGFDNNDNVTSITDAVTTANNQTLGYDTLNRLTSATSGSGGYGSLTWAYDHNGNLTSRVAGGTTFNYALTSGTNRIATTTYPGHTQTVGYTANGNLNLVAQDGVTSFTTTYNVANRLASVTGTPLAVSAIVYDGFGQRFSKQNPGSTPNYYSYDLTGQLIEENDNGAITDYIYVNGRPIGLYVPDGTGSGTLYYVHPDRLGTPQFVTNASQGVVWSTTYQPYGATTIPTGSITQNLRLPGQYFDGDDGFNYNLNRDYFPSWGRYIEADPIGLGGGLNPYLYANANPARFTDRLGLDGADMLGLFLNMGQAKAVDEMTPSQREAAVARLSKPLLTNSQREALAKDLGYADDVLEAAALAAATNPLTEPAVGPLAVAALLCKGEAALLKLNPVESSFDLAGDAIAHRFHLDEIVTALKPFVDFIYAK